MKRKSKLVSLIVTLCMIISMLPNMIFAEETLSKNDIVILHTNDVHSRVDDNLGYTSVKGWKNYFRQNGNDVLLLDAGDALHGLPIANLSNGENIVKIMNEVGYDAMTAGNHDFNYGINQLINLKNKMNYDLLVCNVTKDGKNVFTSSKIYEKGGKKIGVVGISTPETATKTNPVNTEGYSFNPDKLVKIVQKEIDNLKKEGADYVVGLGHLGIDSSSSPYMSTEIISQLEGLDIFVDGHSHSELPNGQIVKDKNGKDVVLAQTGCYISNIGEIVIKEDGTIKASLIKEKKSDEKIDNLISELKAEIQPKLDEVVGHTSVVLDGERDPGVRTKETNLGDLVADTLKKESGADVALMNGGSIRASVDVGDITYGELNAVLPFGNIVTKIKVTGKEIVEALEKGTEALPEASGAFPQVSGITYEVHTYLTENRVKNVKINGVDIDLNKTYTLATNDFVAAGGDGYDMFKTAEKVSEYGALDEALVKYIEELPNGTVGKEYDTDQGRINIYTSAKPEDQNDDDNTNDDDDQDNDDDDTNDDDDQDNDDDNTNDDDNQDNDDNNTNDDEDQDNDEDNTNDDENQNNNQDDETDDNTNDEEQNNDTNNNEDDDNEQVPQTGEKNVIADSVFVSVVSICVLAGIAVDRKKTMKK